MSSKVLGGLSKAVPTLAILLLWYVTLVAVVHAGDGPLQGIVNTVFLNSQKNALGTESLQEAWSIIENDYVIRGVSGRKATDGALSGLVSTLSADYPDHFVTYFPPADYSAYSQELSGEKSGAVGIDIEAECAGPAACAPGTTPTEIVIVGIIPGSAASRARLPEGSEILAVNGTPVKSIGTDAEAQLKNIGGYIDGKPGTKVTLTLSKAGTVSTVTLTRSVLDIPSAFATRIGSVGYLQITEVDLNTGSEVAAALASPAFSHVSGIIIDLRNDPGGYVNVAQEIADEFMPASKVGTPLVTFKERLSNWNDPASAKVTEVDKVLTKGAFAGKPLVVLINGNSASAAEILALGLRDDDGAVLLGTTSYGKGTAQEDFTLPNGGDLHLTFARWFGPKGESINGVGIDPSVKVPLASSSVLYDPSIGQTSYAADSQMRAALGILSGKGILFRVMTASGNGILQREWQSNRSMS